MHCPYCQQPVAEDSAQCAGCGLDLGRVDSVLGIPPVIPSGISDMAQVLSGSAARQIKRALGQFCGRFPQITVAVVLVEAPEVVPLRTWAWWLFNRGNFSAALDKGFMNRDLLLVINPVRRQAALTMGYGLEPFVAPRDLSNALTAGTAALAAGEWAEYCQQVLVALDDGLRQIIGRMSQAYGVPVPLLTASPPPAEGAAVW